jgi:alpha-N-acetylglucosaminidase
MTRQNIEAAEAVLQRLLGPKLAGRFTLSVHQRDGDEFTIDSVDDRIRVEASSVPNVLAGVRWYVGQELNGHVSRHGDQLPTDAPAPADRIRRSSRFAYRFAHNPTVSGYSAAYWEWPEWERELDFLAWSGTTHVLVLTGQEVIYRDLLVELGQTDREARAWLSMPAHMPWQWMGNQFGYGGGQPAELLERRAVLGQHIVERIRQLGMVPVLPGFAGYVPQELIDERDDLSAVPQGLWLGFERPAWVDPTCDGYAELAARWYRLQQTWFGRSTAFSMDVMHEGGTAGEMDVAQAVANMQGALLSAHPDATWVIQAWGSNPTQAMLDGLDTSHLIVLDINADDTPRWSSRNEFDGTPWVFGTISTWGGRQYTFAKLPEICRLPGLPSAGSLCGTIQAAESLESNPVVDELLADAIWCEEEIDLDSWVTAYCRRRYGAENLHAARAWQLFARSAYGQFIGDDVDGSNAGPDSLLVARPGLNVEQAIEWRPRIVPYDAAEFESAWRELLAAADDVPDSSPFGHDVVDFTVQVLSNRSRWLLPQIRAAVEKADSSRFETLSQAFMRLLDQCDQILATREEFLLGTWLIQAGNVAGESGVDDVIVLVTTWGRDRATSELHDYAARHAAGLVSRYYRERWRRFFETVRSKSEQPDWFALEREWANTLVDVPTVARGDAVSVARLIARTLPATPRIPVTLEVTAESQPDRTLVTATLINAGDAVVHLNRARLLQPSAEPLLNRSIALAPHDTHRLHWELPAHSDVSHVEVAAYLDPSSSTTTVVRGVLSAY